jgi:hypothetical protein
MRVSATEHYYLSTACLHQLHSYCIAPVVSRDGTWQVIGPSYSAELGDDKKPAQCKFCAAQCICPCHRGEPIPMMLPTGDD